GRFRFGIGVAHAPSHRRMGVVPGRPLADIRDFVARFRTYDGFGALPPIILAALRKRMVALAGEIADGLIFANGSRSHMRESLSALPAAKRGHPDFLVANMIPTCIADDIEAAKAVNRRTLTRYTLLPNYRNYWKEAGYIGEMAANGMATARDPCNRRPGPSRDIAMSGPIRLRARRSALYVRTTQVIARSPR